MKELSICELRQMQLQLLSDVDTFCRENNIRYSLCGGSLLGAVRHKGYIPWDDDIDIMMPRPDYEKFIASYSSEENYLVNFMQMKGYRETFVKICRKNTVMVDGLLGRPGFGVNIDLFPIDGVPFSTPQQHVSDILEAKEKIAKYCPYYIDMTRGKLVWCIKFIIKRILSCQFNSILKIKDELDLLLKKYSFEDSTYAGVISGSYGYKEVVNKKVFLEYEQIQFEGAYYRAIVNFDEYLRSIYGEYWILPPEGSRSNPHNYKAFTLE